MNAGVGADLTTNKASNIMFWHCHKTPSKHGLSNESRFFDMAQDRMIVPYHRAPLVCDKQLYDVDINVAWLVVHQLASSRQHLI